MDLNELKKELNAFAKYVVSQSRRNLTTNKKNASKALHKSIDYDLKVSNSSFSLFFEMEPYGNFLDKGVSGKLKKYNTPFRYKSKMPPASAFTKWVKQKGIKGRDKKGRFITNKSLTFLIARGVYRNGIKPSLFFTKPFEKAFKTLPDELVEKFGLDVDSFLEHALSNFKDK